MCPLCESKVPVMKNRPTGSTNDDEPNEQLSDIKPRNMLQEFREANHINGDQNQIL